jgi:hypothetical protein
MTDVNHISRLALSYVQKVGEVTNIRSENLMESYLPHLQPLLRKVIADSSPGQSMQERLKSMQASISAHAVTMSRAILAQDKQRIRQNFFRSLEAQGEVYKMARSIAALPQAEWEVFMTHYVRCELENLMQADSSTVQKLEAVLSPA